MPQMWSWISWRISPSIFLPVGWPVKLESVNNWKGLFLNFEGKITSLEQFNKGAFKAPFFVFTLERILQYLLACGSDGEKGTISSANSLDRKSTRLNSSHVKN